jgi:hypothetical protein
MWYRPETPREGPKKARFEHSLKEEIRLLVASKLKKAKEMIAHYKRKLSRTENPALRVEIKHLEQSEHLLREIRGKLPACDSLQELAELREKARITSPALSPMIAKRSAFGHLKERDDKLFEKSMAALDGE